MITYSKTGHTLYHATSYENMQSILKSGFLKRTRINDEVSEICFSANKVMDYGEYVLRFKKKIELPTKLSNKHWSIGGRGDNNEILKVAYKTKDLLIGYFSIFKVEKDDEGNIELRRLLNPYNYFKVEEPTFDIKKLVEGIDVAEYCKETGLLVYRDEELRSTTINLLEGIPSHISQLIKDLVHDKGANPMGFTYYNANNTLYYFEQQVI